MSLRVDKVTKKCYTWHNIPAETVSCIGDYKIFSSTHNHPEDSWHEGRFLGCEWAVFKWNAYAKFWQQVTPWYKRCGNAVRKLRLLAGKGKQ